MSDIPHYLWDEENRLQTFNTWPETAQITPKRLAKAGFYYLGLGDKVRCPFCDLMLENWEQSDSPFLEHKQKSSFCSFVNYLEKCHHNANMNQEVFGNEMLRPKHPEYTLESVRLQSFENWPSNVHQTSAELAKAGFYYIGYKDWVKCFFCDGTLQAWEEGEDALQEHFYWFPECPFVKQQVQEKMAVQSAAAKPGISHTSSGDFQTIEWNSPKILAVQEKGYSTDQIQRAVNNYRLKTEFSKSENNYFADLCCDVIFLQQGVEDIYRGEAVHKNADWKCLDNTVDILHPEKKRIFQTISLACNTIARQTDGIESDLKAELDSRVEKFEKYTSWLDDSADIRGKEFENAAELLAAVTSEELSRPANPLSPKSKSVRTVQQQSEAETAGLMASVTISDNAEVQALIQETLKLKLEMKCRVCQENAVEITLLPCGHLSCCLKCIVEVDQCPVCGTKIRGTLRTYMS